MVFGEYVIHRQAGDGREDPIIIHFESERPTIGRPDGVVSFQCALTHPAWGEGIDRGRATRDRIVATAAGLFRQLGVREHVLAASRVAKGQFYRYFPGKADLVSAVS